VYLHLSQRHLQVAPNPLEQLQVPAPVVLPRSRAASSASGSRGFSRTPAGPSALPAPGPVSPRRPRRRPPPAPIRPRHWRPPRARRGPVPTAAPRCASARSSRRVGSPPWPGASTRHEPAAPPAPVPSTTWSPTSQETCISTRESCPPGRA
jgi:hypothetical protein